MSIAPYLIFVIFFTLAKFLENKIYTKNRVNYDKIHSKLPFFALNMSKFTPARKIYTDGVSRVSDNYQVCS